ncbi:uncharacterized protein LOC113852208 [Abrus precatorius]|uniref:Uncharacterized protein LOC113852208 n=1 Tax=Abrus precatorius TaxID=3816 RepID=A0A8B8K4K1_ABRPR|nr:uncharacterized protein LOC113852208 [Abrus precatorius]
MAFNKTLILFVSISCLLLHTHAAGMRSPQARVWTICKPTSVPLLCYKTILPKVQSLLRFNMYKALEAEVLLTQQQAQKALSLINTLLAKPGNPKGLTDSLQICQDQYGNILDAVAETIKLVEKRDVSESRFKFSAVISYYSSCNDDFNNIPAEFVAESKTVFDLGSNCLDIMKAIDDREMARRARTSPQA